MCSPLGNQCVFIVCVFLAPSVLVFSRHACFSTDAKQHVERSEAGHRTMSAAQRIGDVGMYTVKYKFNCKNRTVYAICDLTVTYGSCSSILMSNAKYVSTKSCGVILSDFL